MTFALLSPQLFRRLGVKELLFTSDGQGSVPKSLNLRPADDVLITINLMTDNGGVEDIKRLQVRSHDCHVTSMLTLLFFFSLTSL